VVLSDIKIALEIEAGIVLQAVVGI
jgi:hypothetical protein